MELNPYGRWTVNIATSRTITNGILAVVTNAPTNTAKPPSSSTITVNQAIRSGAGTPIACKIPPNVPTPFDSFATPWTMKPYPITALSTSAQASPGNLPWSVTITGVGLVDRKTWPQSSTTILSASRAPAASPGPTPLTAHH